MRLSRIALWMLLFVSSVLLLYRKNAVLALSPGRFQFAQTVYYTTEDFGVAYVTVQRHLGTDGRIAVYVSTLTEASASTITGINNAVVGRDFKAFVNRSLVWQDGEDTEKELYVKILNDGQPQDRPKRFLLGLHDPIGGEINFEQNETQVILMPPTNIVAGSFRFLTATLTVNESNSGPVPIPVLWEGGTTATAAVAFEVYNGTALMGEDFTIYNQNNVLRWTRSDANTTQNIWINVTADGVYEPSETFRIELVLIEAAEGDTIGTGTIGNISEVVVTINGPNDVRSGTLQFATDCFPGCASNKYAIADGGVAQVVLQRRNGSNGEASARVSTVDDTAFAGTDYYALSTVVQWDDGDSTDKFVQVAARTGVVRMESARILLVLSEPNGASLAAEYASQSNVNIAGPSNVYTGDVNFALPERLDAVLNNIDRSFLPFVTRMNSRLGRCPRVTVRTAGIHTLLLQRNFATRTKLSAASVAVQTVEGTATADVDFVALSATSTVILWSEGDIDDKTLPIELLDPHQFYTGTRSFFVELVDVKNVALGNCHLLEIVIESISPPPHVVAFDLNMNTGTLTLTMSHPVLAGTFDASKLSLQSQRSISSRSTIITFRFSKQTTASSVDGTLISLNIAAADLNALKTTTGLAKDAKTTFLSVDPGLVDYRLENCISGAGGGGKGCAHPVFAGTNINDPLPVTQFTPDTTEPRLLSYTLDLSRQLVKLHFSEPVNFSDVHVDAIAFSDTNAGNYFYSLSVASTALFRPQPDPLSGALLSDANKLPPDGTYVTLLLGEADIRALQSVGNGQVGVQASSTFLSVMPTFSSDFANPPNAVAAITNAPWLRVATADCSFCPANTFLAASCSDMKDRICAPCTMCPTNSFALRACTATEDTVCYPCTECRGGQYVAVACSPTTNRVCATCTKCTLDEYEASPCANGIDRICRSCDSCTLTKEQQRTCQTSAKWKKRQMKMPYSCPLADQHFQTLEVRLQRAKSNRCGAGRCSCSNSGVGNYNPNADSFPDDPRCTGPEVYNIFL